MQNRGVIGYIMSNFMGAFAMSTKLVGELVVKAEQRFAIVAAEFNEFITQRLLASATEAVVRHGGKAEQITTIWVPGCFEIPTIAMQLAQSKKFTAVICLGCVVRGQTDHYDYVAQQVARGVGEIGPKTGVPTIFGVITADTVEQAIDRAGLKSGNTGWNAMCAAVAMANLTTQISKL